MDKAGEVRLTMTPDDCNSETASTWLLMQDTALNSWKDPGLQLSEK